MTVDRSATAQALAKAIAARRTRDQELPATKPGSKPIGEVVSGFNHPGQKDAASTNWFPGTSGTHFAMTNLAVPPTRNPGWGFFGTMTRQAPASPTEAAWNAALTAIVAATACTPDEVCLFLDSRYGRHFADDVSGYLLANQTVSTAIQSAVTRWMGWTITRATSQATGIPSGLPYLMGFVIHATIEAESGTKAD